MKTTLFVQTAFAYHQVLLIRDGEMVKSWENDQSRQTLQFLMRVLKEMRDQEVTEIVFIQGPGSFTSLRVGATWVNTMAFAKSIQIYALPTLDYLGLALSLPRQKIVFTYDNQRFFLAGEDQTVEQGSLPMDKQLLRPDQEKIVVDDRLLHSIQSFTEQVTGAAQTDVLYVVPPKITVPKVK